MRFHLAGQTSRHNSLAALFDLEVVRGSEAILDAETCKIGNLFSSGVLEIVFWCVIPKFCNVCFILKRIKWWQKQGIVRLDTEWWG